MELLGVLLGGLLAVGGSAITQWYLHKVKVEDEERRLRTVKYEELVQAIWDFDYWLAELKDIRVLGVEGRERVTPHGRADAIACAYFPTFADRVEELDRLSLPYRVWTITKARQRLDKKLDGLAEGHDAVYGPYATARQNLVRDLGAYVRRGFK